MFNLFSNSFFVLLFRSFNHVIPVQHVYSFIDDNTPVLALVSSFPLSNIYNIFSIDHTLYDKLAEKAISNIEIKLKCIKKMSAGCTQRS